jgi:hypothetical protein
LNGKEFDMSDYDRNLYSSGADTFGFGGASISLASTDFTVPADVKAIVVTTGGNVVFRAVDGTSDITMTGVATGYVLPYHCSVIRRTGTTATLATIIGRA